MDGSQCTGGLVGILDVAGKYRADLVALQEAVRAQQAGSAPR